MTISAHQSNGSSPDKGYDWEAVMFDVMRRAKSAHERDSRWVHSWFGGGFSLCLGVAGESDDWVFGEVWKLLGQLLVTVEVRVMLREFFEWCWVVYVGDELKAVFETETLEGCRSSCESLVCERKDACMEGFSVWRWWSEREDKRIMRWTENWGKSSSFFSFRFSTSVFSLREILCFSYFFLPFFLFFFIF